MDINVKAFIYYWQSHSSFMYEISIILQKKLRSSLDKNCNNCDSKLQKICYRIIELQLWGMFSKVLAMPRNHIHAVCKKGGGGEYKVTAVLVFLTWILVSLDPYSSYQSNQWCDYAKRNQSHSSLVFSTLVSLFILNHMILLQVVMLWF